MRTGLRILSTVVAVVTLVLWWATGAHTGWTKTQVTSMEVDPITELEYPVTEARFVAGVEVLGGGEILAALLFGISFVFKRQSNKN